MIEFYKVYLPTKFYGYYAGYNIADVKQRAYSDINSSSLLQFEKVEEDQIPDNESIHCCALSFEDARQIASKTLTKNNMSKEIESLSLMELMAAIAYCVTTANVLIPSNVTDLMIAEGANECDGALHMIPYLGGLLADKVNNTPNKLGGEPKK